jgi:hypothetical protein
MPPTPLSLASPETVQRPEPGNVDSRTIIASPLADQISGPMMQQQQQAQESNLIQKVVMPILQRIAERKKSTDPKGSSELYKMISSLVKAIPPVAPPNMSPGGMTRMAGALPQPGGPPMMGGSPPPPVGGTGSPLSGPMAGM